MLSKSSVEAIRRQVGLTQHHGIAKEPPSGPNVTPVVFVVDGDSSDRESLEVLIGDAGWQSETFESAEELLARPCAFVPNCLVLDLTGSNGLELQKRFAAERPDMPVIFMTRHGDVSTAVQAMKAGAIEFLTKPFNKADLLKAIQHAIERSASALCIYTELHALRSSYASLSRREQEVMTLVVRGLLNKQVGFELGISEITVKAHRGRVMRKMNASSFADLVKCGAKLCLGSSSYGINEHRWMNPLLRGDPANALACYGVRADTTERTNDQETSRPLAQFGEHAQRISIDA